VGREENPASVGRGVAVNSDENIGSFKVDAVCSSPGSIASEVVSYLYAIVFFLQKPQSIENVGSSMIVRV